jgi:hypothetical protein
MSDGRPRLGDLLVDLGFIDEAQLEAALAKQRREGGRLGKVLVESAVITEDRLVHALARQLGIDSCDPVMTPIHPKVLELIPKSVAHRHRVLSLARKRENDSEVIYVAMADPLDTQAMEAVRQQVGPNVRLHWMLAGETEMELALEKHLGAPAPASEGGAGSAGASTYQGVPVVQGLPLGRDLPPRRSNSTGSAPSSSPSPPAESAAPPASPSERFAPLAPDAELSPTGSIDQAFSGAFAEGPEEEIPAEAFEEVDPFEDDDPPAEPHPPRLPTSDLEVVAEAEAPGEHELEPIPLDRFAERPEEDVDDVEPGLQTLEGEAIEELPEDAADEPDAISEPFGERPPAYPPPVAPAPPSPPESLRSAPSGPEDGALPPLGPFPSEALSGATDDAAESELAAEHATRVEAPRAPVGPPAAPAGPPTWGDLLGGDPPPRSEGAPPGPAALDDDRAAAAAEAPTPPPEVEALDAVEVESAELEPLDEPAEVSPSAGASPVPLAPGELTERPELEVEPEPEPEDAADPSGPTRDVEAGEPGPGLAAEPTDLEPNAEGESASEGDDSGGDTRPLERAGEGSAQPTRHSRSERTSDDAELDPSPWSDRDTTAGLELDPAPVEDPVAPSGDPLEGASTDDVGNGNGVAPTSAEPSGRDADVEGVGLSARLDRFLAGSSDAAEVEWWTRVLLEILRDADVLTDDRLERAAARLHGPAAPPAYRS